MLTHIKTLAASAQNVISWHPQIFYFDLRVTAAKLEPQFGMGLHGFDIAQDLVARVWQFNNKGAVLLVPCSIWIGFRHHYCDVGNACR